MPRIDIREVKVGMRLVQDLVGPDQQVVALSGTMISLVTVAQAGELYAQGILTIDVEIGPSLQSTVKKTPQQAIIAAGPGVKILFYTSGTAHPVLKELARMAIMNKAGFWLTGLPGLPVAKIYKAPLHG